MSILLPHDLEESAKKSAKKVNDLLDIIKSTHLVEKANNVLGLLKVLLVIVLVILIGKSVLFLVDRQSSNKLNAVSENVKIIEVAPEAVIEPVITTQETQTAESADSEQTVDEPAE
jgi:hypothetical protein